MWIYHIGHICCSDNKVGGFRFALLVYWLINSWISFSFVCVGVWMCGVCKPFLTISRTESNILRHINLVFSPSGKCIWFHCISTCVSCAYVYQFNYVLLLAIESTRFNFHFFFLFVVSCVKNRLICDISVFQFRFTLICHIKFISFLITLYKMCPTAKSLSSYKYHIGLALQK